VLTAFVLCAAASLAEPPTALIAFSSSDGASDATNIAVIAADGTGRRMHSHNDSGGLAPRFTHDGPARLVDVQLDTARRG
jgi:hypothetical protein